MLLAKILEFLMSYICFYEDIVIKRLTGTHLSVLKTSVVQLWLVLANTLRSIAQTCRIVPFYLPPIFTMHRKFCKGKEQSTIRCIDLKQ